MNAVAAFLVSWSLVAGAQLYSVERTSLDAPYAQIASGPGLQIVDSLIVPETFYTYRVRAWKNGIPSLYSEERSAVYYDWSMGKTQTQRHGIWFNDDLVLIMIDLPDSDWDCAVSRDMIVECWCAFDYIQDGRINLSDFAVFGTGEFNASMLARFANVYGLRSYLRNED